MVTQTFKIRRKSDGLFSTGGCDPTFSKRGKTWSSKNALMVHIALVRDGLTYKKDTDRLKWFYGDCDIVVFGELGHYPVVK